jgi:hypothetical protein
VRRVSAGLTPTALHAHHVGAVGGFSSEIAISRVWELESIQLFRFDGMCSHCRAGRLARWRAGMLWQSASDIGFTILTFLFSPGH